MLSGSKTSNPIFFSISSGVLINGASEGVASVVNLVLAIGTITLLVTPYFAISLATIRVKAAIPAFAAP